MTIEEFKTHLPEFNFLSKSNTRIKINGKIKIKTPSKNISLKDDGQQEALQTDILINKDHNYLLQ